jgi:hypothetical protein
LPPMPLLETPEEARAYAETLRPDHDGPRDDRTDAATEGSDRDRAPCSAGSEHV